MVYDNHNKYNVFFSPLLDGYGHIYASCLLYVVRTYVPHKHIYIYMCRAYSKFGFVSSCLSSLAGPMLLCTYRYVTACARKRAARHAAVSVPIVVQCNVRHSWPEACSHALTHTHTPRYRHEDNTQRTGDATEVHITYRDSNRGKGFCRSLGARAWPYEMHENGKKNIVVRHNEFGSAAAARTSPLCILYM